MVKLVAHACLLMTLLQLALHSSGPTFASFQFKDIHLH